MSVQSLRVHPEARPTTEPVLVSFVVRSMGRPELRETLESIARQDHPAIEVVIVDATGGRHPPLPAVNWRDGHVVRLVSAGKPLKRPQAAMLGLESIRGAWLMFLDDDDTCEPTHVSAMLEAASKHPGALVVYGCGRLHDEAGRLQQVFGRPFNRAMMHYGPLFYWQSAIINARVRDLGCGFDPTLEVCEDRDFLAQIAEHDDFVFVPDVATFNYRPDLGTSGTGQGANRNAARVARYENLLRAKWAGSGVYHNERAANLCRSGVRAFFDGDLARSQAAFDRVVAEYPDDPNAVHGLARVALARGDLKRAEHAARRAIEINPLAAEYAGTLNEVLIAAGSIAGQPAVQVSRTAPCPCGSGLRYKACCGRIPDASPTARSPPVDELLIDAERALARGEASFARERLRIALADPRCSSQRLAAAARLELALERPATAFELLQRAAEQGIDNEIGLLLDDACARLARREREASLWRTIRQLCSRSASALADTSIDDTVLRIAVADDASADLRRQAQSLSAVLAEDGPPGRVGLTTLARPEACTTLVVTDPLDHTWPAGETQPRRVIVRMTRDDPEALLRCLARMQQRWPRAALRYTRPHAASAVGIEDGALVEYPWVDDVVANRPPVAGGALVVGIQGAPSPDLDHPDDGSLYRALIADGYRVVVPATPSLTRVFERDPIGGRPDLRPDRVPVTQLDVLLARGDPRRPGWADAHVLEAMAASRPVVAFEGALGAREWLADGACGFVVEDAEEARACIARLAASASLRASIGDAARRLAEQLMHDQRRRVRAYYFGVSVNV